MNLLNDTYHKINGRFNITEWHDANGHFSVHEGVWTPMETQAPYRVVKKAKAHQKYYLDGVEVPGVTTVLNVIAKPALVPWANKLGLQGIEVGKYVDHLAEIGTLAHHLLECYLTEKTPDTTDYSAEQLDKAENALLSYFEWAKGHTLEPVLCEAQLVSSLGFGGTVDCFGLMDGKRTLLDFKTSKAIWPEHLYQVSAYRHLLEEHGHPVEQVMILQIGREESEGFSTRVLSDTTKQFELFTHCLEIWRLQKLTK